MGTKSCTKIFQDFQMAGNVLSWQNLSPIFSNGGCHEILMRRDKSIAPLLFLGGISIKRLKHHNAHGDCGAAIANAAAAVTHVQSLIQEIGSGDEGLGLFGFDLSSAETGFWWLAEEQEKVSKPIHGIDLGTWLQKKLKNLCAAPDELDHACREARDIASHFRVSYDIFMFIMEAAKPVSIGPQPYPVIYVVANPVRGLLDRKRSEEHLQSSNESKRKTRTNKNDKEKGIRIIKYTCQKKIDEGHSIERVWHSASREPSDTLPGSKPCTQTRSIYHIPYSQGFSFH